MIDDLLTQGGDDPSTNQTKADTQRPRPPPFFPFSGQCKCTCESRHAPSGGRSGARARQRPGAPSAVLLPRRRRLLLLHPRPPLLPRTRTTLAGPGGPPSASPGSAPPRSLAPARVGGPAPGSTPPPPPPPRPRRCRGAGRGCRGPRAPPRAKPTPAALPGPVFGVGGGKGEHRGGLTTDGRINTPTHPHMIDRQ